MKTECYVVALTLLLIWHIYVLSHFRWIKAVSGFFGLLLSQSPPSPELTAKMSQLMTSLNLFVSKQYL